jgi:predicted RND superfamily exporter protein
MKKFSESVIKYRKLIIFTTILITLVLGYCLKDLSISSDILSYLPQDDPKVMLFNEVGDKFGGSSLAMVALECEDAFNHATLTRVDEITQQFKEMDEIFHVMSLTDIIDIKKTEWGLEISKLIDNDNIPRDSEELLRLRKYALSKDMYRGNLISDDGKITVIIARLKQDADELAIGRQMKEVVERTRGIEKIYYGGIPFQMIFLTDIIQSDLIKLIPLVILLVMGVLFVSFRSLRGVFLPLSCVLISTIWVLGFMSLLKIPLTIVSNAFPILLIAVGSAYGIHMLSKYNENVHKEEGKIQDIKDALSEVGFPILLAGLTTLIGFLAFLTSKLSLIREFGIFTALGVGFAMIISMTFLPAVLSFMKVKRIKRGTKKIEKEWTTRMMDKLGGFVLRNAKLISAFCIVVVLFSLFMVTRLSREVNMVDYFKKNSEIRQAEEMMEDRLGGSIPVQIVVKGDLKNPFVLKEIMKFEKYLEAQPSIRNPLSIADLICEMNWMVNGRHTIPETREGVANLWFFIEGNEILNQLITNDATEALIQAKLGTVNTKKGLALVNQVEGYINKELRTDLVELRISLVSSDFAAELAKERMEQILSKIDWDIRKRGLAWTAHNSELKEMFFTAANPNSGGLNDAMIDVIGMKVSDYLHGDSADIQVESERVISAIIADIGDSLRLSKSGERIGGAKTPEWGKEDTVDVLKKNVPQTLYADDPKALDYAAETIVTIIKDEKNWARMKRLIQDIKPFLPESLADDEKFLSDLRDDVWEINEDRMAIEGSKYESLSGNTNVETRTKLSAQQTGMPIIYNDLDKNIVESQALSLSIAILLVFLLLAFRLKSLIGGLISITPIVLTILINFTIMVIFDIPLDVVTVLIGSVAVGVGIDYTIHFIVRFKVEHAQGKTKLEALDKTLETTGKAIVINALSVTMGFLVLVLGNIVPMQRFGYLIALTMIISATASITILPSLLLVTRPRFIGRLGLLSNGLVSKVTNKINAKNNFRNKEEKCKKLH